MTNKRSIPFTRLHHALNGAEVRDIMLKQLKEALDRDKRFNISNTFPIVSWVVAAHVTAQPRENPELFVEVQAGAMEVDSEGHPVVGEHGEFEFTVTTGQGYDAAPDDVRAKHNLDSPIAVRTEGLPIAEEDADRRTVVIPEDATKAPQVLAKAVQLSPLARKLEAAHIGRPHKIVEESPLAAEHQRRNLGIVERKSAESTHAQDPRIARTVEGEGTGLQPTDPRFKLPTAPIQEDPLRQVATVGPPKADPVPPPAPLNTEPKGTGTVVYDPREEAGTVKFAAEVEIKPGSEHESRALELRERAAERRDAGEDMSVKIADDSVEKRGTDDISDESPMPPDPEPRSQDGS